MKKKSEKQGELIKIRIELSCELYERVKRASEEAGVSMKQWVHDATMKFVRKKSARCAQS